MVNSMMNYPFRPLPGNFGFMSNELALDTETALWPFGYANTGVNNTTARSDGVDIQLTQFDYTRFCDSMFEQTNIYCPEAIILSINKRKAEYFVGRYLVASKLEELGFEHCTLEPNIDRSPQFPVGTIGSISHCESLACVAVTPSYHSDRENLGIDVQKIISSDVCNEIGSMIVEGQEVDLAMSAGLTKEQAITLLFSAKESIYKALVKFSTRDLNFKDAKLKQITQNAMEFGISESVNLRNSALKEISCEYWYLESHKAFLTFCYYSHDK